MRKECVGAKSDTLLGRWAAAGRSDKATIENAHAADHTMKLAGDVAIVTGAAGGIGGAVAGAFASEGADLCLADLEPVADAVAACRALGRRAIDIPTDFLEHDGWLPRAGEKPHPGRADGDGGMWGD